MLKIVEMEKACCNLTCCCHSHTLRWVSINVIVTWLSDQMSCKHDICSYVTSIYFVCITMLNTQFAVLLMTNSHFVTEKAATHETTKLPSFLWANKRGFLIATGTRWQQRTKCNGTYLNIEPPSTLTLRLQSAINSSVILFFAWSCEVMFLQLERVSPERLVLVITTYL